MLSVGYKIRHAYREKAQLNMHYDNWVAYRNASVLVEIDTPTYQTEIERQFYLKNAVLFDRQRLSLSQGIVYG